MATITPSSITNLWLIPRAVFTVKKNDCFVSRKAAKQPFLLPLSPSFRKQYVLHSRGRSCLRATGTDVAVEEQESPPVVDENSGGETEVKEKVEASSVKGTRPGGRKSEMPAVKNEELVAGATFTGKVRAIQPFGAFVDFGAFTDGLVHVSQLSDNYVKDVSSVVSIGQEVKVRLVEADITGKRISLTMRENDDPPKRQGSDKPRGGGKRTGSKGGQDGISSKFAKGQMLDGTVKNLTRSGSFISLPEGEEGFLPTAEEADDGIGSMMGASTLQTGQEVKVRVLKIARGRVTLTMKEEDDGKFDETFSQGVVHTATNPFLVAFRKNEEIAAFLDKREDEKVVEEPASGLEETVAEVEEPKPVAETVEEANDQILASETPKDEEEVIETKAEVEEPLAEAVEKESEQILASETSKEEEEEVIQTKAEAEEPEPLAETNEEPNEQILASETPKEEEVIETKAEDESQEKEEKIADENGSLVNSEAIQDVSANQEIKNQEEIAENSLPPNPETDEVSSLDASESEKAKKEEEVVAEAPVLEAETPVLEAEAPVLEAEAPESVNTETADTDSATETIKAGISPALVKQLREETGAGMMDCKKALSESEGDMTKAQEYLRKKGLASADKKASRATAEGRIGAYIHDSRIGVLMEVNCETDFVSRGDIFKGLVDDLAMQVAACPQVEYLVTEEVAEEIVKKEKEIEMQKEDLLSKPEQIREKIVEGRIKKRLEALALLEQPYIKDDKVIVKDLVKQTIATVGENIKVKRFVRYNLGEGLEKKSQDFAAEVAAQTAAKPKTKEENELPKAEAAAPSPAVKAVTAVSAGLVKQLREETGAGMMDCKKALAETGGDLEKAQEYLRKKGLSTADKKSNRLAAEGRIGAYIHDSRIGVLIEVNCETDFVGRSEKFKELVDDLAMQAAANPQVQYVAIEDIPEEIKTKEKEIEMQREDLLSKPENIKEKIVEGRISKRLGELALLEQPYIKDDSVLVKDLVKQTVATLGENIKVRRFARFTLGEQN